MASSGGGNESPFGDIVFVEYSPNDAFGRFPAFFPKLHPNDVPMHAELLDPVGNLNIIHVEKIGDHCYFTDGWIFFGNFYGIQVPVWVRLDYVRRGCFEITIRTLKGVEWIYPPIPEPLEGGFGSDGLNEGDSDQQRLIANKNSFPYAVVKFVSFSEYTGDVMSLPKGFYTDGLINPEAEIYIIDEFGKRWPCVLRRGYGDQAEACFVCRGWARFCRRKGIQQGQKIMFGVTNSKSNQLHFIPVV